MHPFHALTKSSREPMEAACSRSGFGATDGAVVGCLLRRAVGGVIEMEARVMLSRIANEGGREGEGEGGREGGREGRMNTLGNLQFSLKK